jgi:hypothetical protein
MPGFRAKPEKPSRRSYKKPVTESSGSGMQAARQIKPETMSAWTGVFVRSNADIPSHCICDWIYHLDVLEIKYANALCPISHKT